MSRLSEIERPPAADAPPRTRVSAAARRRAPQAARVPVHEESRRAAPWGALVVVVVLAGGGFAAFQNLPKAEQKAEAPPGFTEALRAAPADSPFTPAEEDDTLEATSFADAASVPAPVAKRDAAAKKPVRVAEAPKPREGIGGPIVTIAPKDTGGGAKTPPPVVTFRPAEPAPAVSTPAPTPAPAVAPPVDAIDPTPAPAPSRYVTARWVKQPGAQALARYFPQAALDSGLSGTAVLDCAILQSGKLNCVVQSETPRGHGFGAAAVSVSQSYLASPQAADGTMAYGNRTRLTLQFK
jgi:protein TonB